MHGIPKTDQKVILPHHRAIRAASGEPVQPPVFYVHALNVAELNEQKSLFRQAGLAESKGDLGETQETYLAHWKKIITKVEGFICDSGEVLTGSDPQTIEKLYQNISHSDYVFLCDLAENGIILRDNAEKN